MFDQGETGSITLKEVETALNTLGYYPSQQWLKDTMKEFDEDENDQIGMDRITITFNYRFCFTFFLKDDGNAKKTNFSFKKTYRKYSLSSVNFF